LVCNLKYFTEIKSGLEIMGNAFRGASFDDLFMNESVNFISRYDVAGWTANGDSLVPVGEHYFSLIQKIGREVLLG
jgi:hypothetical protein